MNSILKINIADSIGQEFFINLMAEGLDFLGKQAIDKNKIDGDYMVFGGDTNRLKAIADILRGKNIRVLESS